MAVEVYAILADQLYCRPRTVQLPLAAKLRMFRSNGITMIVNLWPNGEDAELRGLQEITYVHLPISDGRIRPWITEVERVAEQAAAHILEDRGAVLTQCYGGRNRAGLMAALIVRRVLGFSGAEALALVQQRRPNSLVNEHFAAYLRSLP